MFDSGGERRDDAREAEGGEVLVEGVSQNM
jgi:hypothetical protein